MTTKGQVYSYNNSDDAVFSTVKLIWRNLHILTKYIRKISQNLYGEICTFWKKCFRKITQKIIIWRNLHILPKVFYKNYFKILFGEICTFCKSFLEK